MSQRFGIRNAEDPIVTGHDGSRAIFSALRVETNDAHWYITVFNRGGNAGTLCVNAADGQHTVDRFISPQFQFKDDTV